MKPTAIQQMKDILFNYPNKDNYVNKVVDELFGIAKSLAALEAKEKPQADAGLVEEVEWLYRKGYITREAHEILSKYHPAHSTTDIVGVIRAEADKYAKMPTISFEADEYDRIKGISQGLYMAAELARKFSNEKGGV